MITLEGIIYKAFGNSIVLRGFAPIGEIASISEKPDSYQREPNPKHLREIVEFLDKGEYKFFPEIILACRANQYEEFLRVIGNDDDIDPYSARFVDGLFVKSEYIPIRGNRARHANLSLDSYSQNMLKRVDGNHRLTPFDLSSILDKKTFNYVWHDLRFSYISDIIVPFCIIFTNDADDQADKFEASIFNNINFKQWPLKQEKNLQNIHKYLQQSDELGEYHSLTVKLIDMCERGCFKGINILTPIVRDENEEGQNVEECNVYRTACLKISKLLIDRSGTTQTLFGEEKIHPDIDDVEIAIQSLRPVYAKFGLSRGNLSLLAALVYYQVSDNEKFNNFVEWVLKNGINKIPADDYLPSHNATSLIDLFEQVYESKRSEVFISMQFGDPQSELIYEKIVRAIEAYNKEENRDVQIRPIRIDRHNRGETYTITDEILNAIDSCSLLIADLSSGNKNVYHEIGYAMALAKVKRREPSVLLLLKEDSDKIEKGGDVDKFVGFNIRGFSQLRFTQYEDLVVKLIEQLKTHFSL